MNLESSLARLEERLENFMERLETFEKKLEKGYVTKDEFNPVRALVYGFAGLIFIGFVTALIAVIIP